MAMINVDVGNGEHHEYSAGITAGEGIENVDGRRS